VVRFLEGLDVREITLGTFFFCIIALTLNFALFQMTPLGDFNRLESHLDITKGTTIHSIEAKVDLINRSSFRDVDIQLACSEQICTVSFSSGFDSEQARIAQKRFEDLMFFTS
jgi:hypothetical protein